MSSPSLTYILTGQLHRDFILYPDGSCSIDVPGGNLVYAAVGIAVWRPEVLPGLVARVGEDYPREWLVRLSQLGFNIDGIKVLPDALDLRSFFVYLDRYKRLNEDPVTHFAHHGIPLPKALLNYRQPSSVYDERVKLSPTSLRQADLPEAYLHASAAHLCPQDYLSHTMLPAVLRQAGLTTVTLDPSENSMTPTCWDDIPALVSGLTAFLPSEKEIRNLFHGRSTDLWEMAEALGRYGCEFIIIKRGESGVLLYDAVTRSRWEISAYPGRVVDTTGVGDAFCGGFLFGYRSTYDPLQATLFGSISASLVIEGRGAFYALDALPGLAEARLQALKESVHKV